MLLATLVSTPLRSGRRLNRTRRSSPDGYRGDNLSALTDSGGNPLHRCRTHIADGEYASEAGFECVPPGGVAGGRIAGRHEAPTVQYHAGVGEKIGVGFRADEQEKMADCL